jgi:Arc/MetJ-type ribon-helix-helix transcriptional regulator
LGGNNGNKHPHQEFKINAADEKGHVERIQLRVPPQMLSKMQRVVNSKLWPYENYQEFVRHAIMRALNWLEADSPEVGNLTAQIASMNMMMNEEMEYQKMQETYEKMQMVFQKNLAIGGEQARNRNLRLVSDLWRDISKIDDEFWRGVWMDKFRKEYDKVLEAVPGICLGDLADGEMDEGE